MWFSWNVRMVLSCTLDQCALMHLWSGLKFLMSNTCEGKFSTLFIKQWKHERENFQKWLQSSATMHTLHNSKLTSYTCASYIHLTLSSWGSRLRYVKPKIKNSIISLYVNLLNIKLSNITLFWMLNCYGLKGRRLLKGLKQPFKSWLHFGGSYILWKKFQ